MHDYFRKYLRTHSYKRLLKADCPTSHKIYSNVVDYIRLTAAIFVDDYNAG